MIVNLTHREDGSPIQKLTVGFKVSIGIPAGDGKNYPQKDDHFHIKTKNSNADWIDDKAFYETLRNKYMPEIDVNGKKERPPLREFDIVFLSDNIDDVWKTELAWWASSEKKCFGDGRIAQRSVTALDKKQQEEHKGQRWVEWTPCGDTCPDYDQGKCKPSGQLFFIFKDRPIMGSVVAFYTTSYETIKRIQSSLLQIQSVTGGRLKGIPLKIVIRPGRTRYEQDGKAKSGTAYFVNIEFRHDDYSKLLPGLIQQSLQYERTLLASRKMLAATIDEEDAIVIDEPSGKEMVAEFYPQNAHDNGSGQDVPVATSPWTTPAATAAAATNDEFDIAVMVKALHLNDAQRDMLYQSLKGDLGAIKEWLRAFQAGVTNLNANQAKIQEWFVTVAPRPETLAAFLLKQATPAKEQTPTRKKAEKAPEPVPSIAEAFGPVGQDETAPKESVDSRWDFS